MRFREVLRYEIAYTLRSPSTWAYGGILFLLAIVMFNAVADSPGLLNTPHRMAWAYVRPGIFGILVTAALFGSAAVRDVQAGMDPLVFTSPVRKAELLAGRFLGALTVNAVVLLVIPLGLMVATALVAPSAPESIGPFRLAAHMQGFFVFLLPNLVLVAAILFAVGALSRHVVPVYLAAVAVVIGSVVALNYAGRIESARLVTLADPLGLVTLDRVVVYWTEAERSARLIGLPGPLVWNRAFWLGVAALAAGVLHGTYRFAHAAEGGGRRKSGVVAAPSAERSGPVAVPRVQGVFGRRTTVRQTLAVARGSVSELAGSRWFAAAVLASTGLTLLWGWNVTETVFDTSTWPVTLLVAEGVLAGRAFPLFWVLIPLYAGELVWRARDAGVAEIADASPVPEGAALIGRFLALMVMIVAIQVASLAGGVLIQLFQGYTRLEPGLYLRIVFGLMLAHLTLLAVLAMTIHVVVNHKGLGHMVTILAFLFVGGIAEALGIEHGLLVYGSGPGWTYSDMNGFGPYVAPFVWFKLYWAAWALLLGVGAALFWVRGTEPGLRHRLRTARARLTGPVARTAGVAVVLIVSLGGFVFYNTNVLNVYRPADERGLEQVEYERRYARYGGLAQPTITHATLRAEVYPDDPAVDLGGVFRLVNHTGQPIDSVHVVVVRDVEVVSLSFDRAARPATVDPEVGYRVYALERALAPGDSLALAFDVAFRPRGFRNSGNPTDVVANGAYFDRRWLPMSGYQPALELTDDETRTRFGLAPRAPRPAPDDPEARRRRYELSDADRVQADITIGTPADQVAVAAGILQRGWTENGRAYVHYRTEAPTAFAASIFTARYAVVEDRWNDVALSVFHHPDHRYNLDRTMASMKASLDYYSRHFGPYRGSQLRVVEIPRYGGFGRAHPYMISFTEDYFFSRVREGEIDQPFYGTAHEVAHMWWGGQLRSAAVLGAGFLSESLANYSAMMVVEETFGRDEARRVYGFHMERYLRGRASQAREVPVLEVEDQPYISYRKGAIAMYTLRERIGAEAVNGALRRTADRYRDAGPPYPTSLDLYAELRAATPDSLHALLTDLFETITLWDVRAERATVEPTESGAYEVTLHVSARKLRADGVGNETEAPMDDLIEIGVYAPGEGGRLGEALHLERHRIRSGEQAIRIVVPRAPARAGVDPRRELIERQRADNVVDVGAS